MDLASAPNLTKDVSASDSTGDRLVEVQSLSVQDIAAASFQDEWQSLADNASEPNPFFEPWFVTPSLDAFLQSKSSMTLLAMRCQGDLVGLIPVVKEWTYYGYPLPHISTWTHDNAFCGVPLVKAGHETRFWRALLENAEAGSKASLFLHLPMLPIEGELYAALVTELSERKCEFAIVEQQNRAFLTSELSSEDYFEASMTTKKRKELRRQRKRLSEEGELTFTRASGTDNVDTWVHDFFALEAAGWKGDAGSALANSSDTKSFFAEALSGAAAAGRLERLTLMLNGRPIAMLANFISSPGVFSFKTTFDERFARFSPGMLLQIENLALLDRDDIAWADSCAAEGHPMIERLWREKRTLASINIAIGGPFRRAIARRLMAHETRSRTVS